MCLADGQEECVRYVSVFSCRWSCSVYNVACVLLQMVWESGCVVIVMLTPLTENGVKQCYHYWPDEGSNLYHIYEVTYVQISSSQSEDTVGFCSAVSVLENIDKRISLDKEFSVIFGHFCSTDRIGFHYICLHLTRDSSLIQFLLLLNSILNKKQSII